MLHDGDGRPLYLRVPFVIPGRTRVCAVDDELVPATGWVVVDWARHADWGPRVLRKAKVTGYLMHNPGEAMLAAALIDTPVTVVPGDTLQLDITVDPRVIR